MERDWMVQQTPPIEVDSEAYAEVQRIVTNGLLRIHMDAEGWSSRHFLDRLQDCTLDQLNHTLQSYIINEPAIEPPGQNPGADGEGT